MAASAAAIEEGLTDPAPWRGWCRAIEEVCAISAQDRRFTTAFVSAFPPGIDIAATRETLTLLAMTGGGIRAPSPAARPAA
jgi:hypothetical protein